MINQKRAIEPQPEIPLEVLLKLQKATAKLLFKLQMTIIRAVYAYLKMRIRSGRAIKALAKKRELKGLRSPKSAFVPIFPAISQAKSRAHYKVNADDAMSIRN